MAPGVRALEPVRARLEWTRAGEVGQNRSPSAPVRRLPGEGVMSRGWIGRRVAPKEDHRFLTGRGLFTDGLAERYHSDSPP